MENIVLTRVNKCMVMIEQGWLLMSNDWHDVGRNPYGEPVQENLHGRRRTALPGGWVDEAQVAPARACRALNLDDVAMAGAAMAVPAISRSYEHHAARAFLVWRTPTGQPCRLDAATLAAQENDTSPGWLAFRARVARALGDRAIRAWAERSGWTLDLARWEVAMRAPNLTLTRGAQLGMARYLEQRVAAGNERWVELGVVDPMDAAAWRVPVSHRRVWSARLNAHPVAPWSKVATTWPAPPVVVARSSPAKAVAVGGFRPQGLSPSTARHTEVLKGQDDGWTWDPNAHRLLWCTDATLAQWGDQALPLWWEWFATVGQGIVVFQHVDTPQQRAFFQALQTHKRAAVRWSVRSEHGLEMVVWRVGSDVTETTMADVAWTTWIGACPPPRDESVQTDEDDFGRVPYRSLSRSSAPEGVAPRRLEQSMFHALTDLSRERGDVDAWLAQGLGIPVATLPERLSAEQVDAVALGLRAMDVNGGLVLADETGFGKGRILAALAHIGLRAGKTVVLFTENSLLFSDFYRDLLAVTGGNGPMPTLLHQDASVLTPDGTLVVKSNKGEAFKAQLMRSDWEDGEPRLILSTYAQLNRSGKPNAKGKTDGNPKRDWVLERMGSDGWLLLDEAHNAAGDSNVADNLSKLISKANGVVFSSATFAKTEDNLALYEKALPVDRWTYKVLRRAMAGDDGGLRESLTTAMAHAGRFVRREHPPVPPPVPLWVPLTPERQAAVQAFSTMWQRLFEASEAWETALGGRASIAWLKLGAALSRSIRQFSMLMKADALVEEVFRIVESGEKAVIVVESTFEAALRDALMGRSEFDDEDDEEDDSAPEDLAPVGESEWKKPKVKAKVPPIGRQTLDAPPLWKTRWNALLNEVSPVNELPMVTGDPTVDAAHQAIARAEAAIAGLPDWDLSPLDRVQRDLRAKGMAVGELSGRTLTLNPEVGSDRWTVAPRAKPLRHNLVRSFNNGELNVIIVTRAGCSGISLHAGKTFKDQRVRNLIEWDIAANPANRIQFWGRVRRKDQVVEPRFWGLALDTLGERRALAKENRKRERLAAHVGQQQQSKTLGWLTVEGEALVAEWAAERPKVARRLGVAQPINDDPTGRVDRALVRSIVLPDGEQQALLERLERGLAWASDVAERDRKDPVGRSSRVVRRAWWWGHDGRSEDGEHGHGALGMPRLDIVERVWHPQEGASVQRITQALQERRASPEFAQRAGPAVLERWKNAWAQETAAHVPATAERRRAWAWASQHLPWCTLGLSVRITRPGSGDPVWGMILGVDAPDAVGRSNGASPWALSQVALEVWLLGEPEPFHVPLSRCAQDPSFMLSGERAPAAWFEAPAAPSIGVTIEGNPVLAAAWGRRWQAGRPMLVRDDERGPQWVWALPQSWDWNTVQNLPRDLVDVEHVLAFWKNFSDAPLTASQQDSGIVAIPVQGGVSFQFTSTAYRQATDTWLGFKADRAMGHPKVVDGKIERKVAWTGLRGVLYNMESAGIGWRCGPQFIDWYRTTSRTRIENPTGNDGGTDKGASKGRPGGARGAPAGRAKPPAR